MYSTVLRVHCCYARKKSFYKGSIIIVVGDQRSIIVHPAWYTERKWLLKIFVILGGPTEPALLIWDESRSCPVSVCERQRDESR